jgi:hypothetical protein
MRSFAAAKDKRKRKKEKKGKAEKIQKQKKWREKVSLRQTKGAMSF